MGPPLQAVEGADSVTYNHEILGPVVVLPPSKLDVKIQLSFSKVYTPTVMPNFVGLMGRVRRAKYAKHALDHMNVPYGDNRKDLASYALTAANMDLNFLRLLPVLWSSARKEVEACL